MNKNNGINKSRKRQSTDKWLQQLLPPNKQQIQQQLSDMEKQWIEEEEDKSYEYSTSFNIDDYEQEEESEQEELYSIEVKNNRHFIMDDTNKFEIVSKEDGIYINFQEISLNYTQNKKLLELLIPDFSEKIEELKEDYHLIENQKFNSQLNNKLKEIEHKIDEINNYKPKYPIYNEFFKVPQQQQVYEKDREKTKMKNELKNDVKQLIKQHYQRSITKIKNKHPAKSKK